MKDSTINVLSFVVLIAVLAANALFQNQFAGGTLLLYLSLGLIGVGLIIWVAGRVALGVHFTTSIEPKGLVTHGIYSVFSHPMYYGAILMYIGLSLFLRSWVGLVLAILVIIPMLFYFMRQEEAMMQEKFKDQYASYRKKTIL